jgi:hypothetical protein
VIVSGTHRLDMMFTSNGVRRCVPLTITSPAPERAWVRENHATAAMTTEFLGHTRPVNGSTATIGLGVYFGGWASPSTRLMAGTGFFVDACSLAVCYPLDEGKQSSMIDLPLVLRADAYPVTWTRAALGAGVRYALMGTFLDRLNGGHKAAAYHSLALTPRLALTAPNRPNAAIETGIRAISIELELPVGLSTPLDDYAHPAVTVGFGLVLAEGL